MRDYFVGIALEIDPREAKLPAWAREKLKTMRSATTESRDELRALKEGTTPAPFWIENITERPTNPRRFYLPAGCRIKWNPDQSNGAELEEALEIANSTDRTHVRDGLLSVQCRGGQAYLIVSPQDAGSVLIDTERSVKHRRSWR